MSSGGSNYSTGTTGGGNQVSVDTPASNPNSFTKTSAPGGKGGFPSAQSPYAQQQPQMYMPPQQPSMYQQAFPQQYSGYNNYRNAYARPYSPQTPIGAPRPMDEMRYAPGGLEQAPGQLMSDSWSRRRTNPDDFRPLAPPSDLMLHGGPVERTSYPVAATQGVVPEPNYSGGLGSLTSNSSNPAYAQQAAFNYGNSEEARRNSIQRQLNDAFTASQKAGKSIRESAREEDEMSAKLHAQYGLKPHMMSSG